MTETKISLLDYYNNHAEAGAKVVLHEWSTAHAFPQAHPLDGDSDYAEQHDLWDLTGTVDAQGEWTWDGEGSPKDFRGNSITGLTAEVNDELWESLDESEDD